MAIPVAAEVAFVSKTFAAGQTPSALATAYFNNDGFLDLAVVNRTSDTLGILYGDGKGGFGQMQSYATGPEPGGLAIADLNGDGMNDIAVANSGRNNISLFFIKRDGHFAGMVPLAAGGVDEQSISDTVVAADFNSDGMPDIAMNLRMTHKIAVLFGDDTGKFETPVLVEVGDQPRAMASGDFAGNERPLAVAVADFSGDDNLDIAVINGSSNIVGILTGGG